jgi:hypothetical protein
MKKTFAILCLITLAACGGEAKTEAPAAAAPPPTADPSAAATAVAVTPPPPEPPKSLYDRMGGGDGVTKLVDAALAALKADKKVARYLPRDQKKLAGLHDDLVAQIGAAAGGPASTRSDPRTAVAAMKIKAKDVDVIVDDISKAAGGALGAPEAKEVVDALTTMKDTLAAGAKK